MKIIRDGPWTHFDTIGVRPGDPDDVLHTTFWEQMKEFSEDRISNFARWQAAQAMKELIDAYLVVGHADERKVYDKKIRKELLVCSLCDGTGKNPMGEKDIFGRHKQFITCAPCGGSGRTY